MRRHVIGYFGYGCGGWREGEWTDGKHEEVIYKLMDLWFSIW